MLKNFKITSKNVIIGLTMSTALTGLLITTGCNSSDVESQPPQAKHSGILDKQTNLYNWPPDVPKDFVRPDGHIMLTSQQREDIGIPRIVKLLSAGEQIEIVDEKNDHLYYPHRSTVFAPRRFY